MRANNQQLIDITSQLLIYSRHHRSEFGVSDKVTKSKCVIFIHFLFQSATGRIDFAIMPCAQNVPKFVSQCISTTVFGHQAYGGRRTIIEWPTFGNTTASPGWFRCEQEGNICAVQQILNRSLKVGMENTYNRTGETPLRP